MMKNTNTGYGDSIANGPDAPKVMRDWQLVLAWLYRNRANWDHITG